MVLRHYDPAIARWVGIDPVTHHNFSPYQAFDNNPVYWADPSGADAVYNWEGENEGQYTDNGEVVSFEDAMASNGFNADGSEKKDDDSENSPPTEFKNEKGETIVKTDDGSDDIYIITKKNENAFLNALRKNIGEGKDDSDKENRELGVKFGTIFSSYGAEIRGDFNMKMGYTCGYLDTTAACLYYDAVLLQADRASSFVRVGKKFGNKDREKGYMNKLKPSLSNKSAQYNIKDYYDAIELKDRSIIINKRGLF